MGDKAKVCVTARVSKVGAGFAMTRAEVYLDRLAANTRAVKRFIGESVELMAAVKADAYGHGAVGVASTLLESGASGLAVYTLAEALHLRKSGITAPVLVLGPIEGWQAEKCVNHDLTPCVNGLRLGEALSAAAQRRGVTVPYHVELDTGLTRYGILPAEALPFLQALDRLPALRREGLFTHFAAADEEIKESTWKQFKVFTKARAALAAQGMVFPKYHVANSAATLEFPEMHLDMVRCGIALYGYYPSRFVHQRVELQPVLALGSHLARVHPIRKGVGVSYGYDWRAERKSVIGLVPFGYADGMPRTVQGRGEVLVHGRRAPIVGRVAMDQFMIDLSMLKEAREGDEVTIIGRSGDDEITADEIGAWAGTISYDVLSGISPRVPRLYIEGDRAVAGRLAMTTEVGPVELATKA